MPKSRIQTVLDGREITPWGKALGLSSTTIQGLAHGGNPTADALTVVQWVENVSLSWLLTGAGQPYLVSSCIDDDEAHEALGQLLNDEAWQRGAACGAGHLAAILTMPATLEKPGKPLLAYTAVSVVTGLGQRAAQLLCADAPVQLYQFSSAEINDLVRGRMGAYRILTPGGTVRSHRLIDDCADLIDDTPDRGLVPLRRDERVVLSHYNAMEPDARSAYNKVGASMAQHAQPVPRILGKAAPPLLKRRSRKS